MNEQESRTLVGMMLAFFPLQAGRFTPANIEAYERGIAELEAGEAQAAIESLVKSLARVPYVSEIMAEAGRARAERTRLTDASSRLRAARAPSGMPAPSEWAAVLPRMLEEDARHRRIEAAWRKSKGLAPRPWEPSPMLELVKRGARGEDVLTATRAVLGAFMRGAA